MCRIYASCIGKHNNLMHIILRASATDFRVTVARRRRRTDLENRGNPSLGRHRAKRGNFLRFRGNPRSGKASREARFGNLEETPEAETSARSTVFGDLKETQEAVRCRKGDFGGI